MSNPYCAISDLQARRDIRQIAQLSTDDDTGNINNTNVQAIIDTQAGRLDTTLSGRVALPLVSVPVFLTGLVADLAFYALFERRGDAPESVAKAADAAEKWMEDFRAGRVMLPASGRISQPALDVPRGERRSITDGLAFFPSERRC